MTKTHAQFATADVIVPLLYQQSFFNSHKVSNMYTEVHQLILGLYPGLAFFLICPDNRRCSTPGPPIFHVQIECIWRQAAPETHKTVEPLYVTQRHKLW